MEWRKEWNKNIEESQQFREVKNVIFFWDKKLSQNRKKDTLIWHRHWLGSSEKPVAVLQKRNGKNGLQKEKETGVGSCGGERKG